jgi:hypothetical protein
VLNGDFVPQHRPIRKSSIFKKGDARLRAFLENRRFSDQALRPVHLKSEAFLTEVNLHKIL